MTSPFRVFFTALAVLGGFVLPAESVDALAGGFRRPPASAKPHVWWHWMNGNVSKAGITADLEAMSRAGIGGAQMFDVDDGIPAGSVTFGSDAWWECLEYANREAKRLGLELCLANCSGWSSSGGPWVRPEDSMKEIVWTETVVGSGRRFSGRLPRPDCCCEFYRDIAVLAVPRPAAERIPTTSEDWPHDAKEIVLELGKPFPLSGVNLDFQGGSRYGDAEVSLWATDGGGECTNLLSHVKLQLSVYGFRDVEHVFLPARMDAAVRVRVRLDNVTGDYRPTRVTAEVRGLIPGWKNKTFGRRGTIVDWPYSAADSQMVDPKACRILTDKMSADGVLHWRAPEGREWIVFRFGYASNGGKTRASTRAGEGLEVDKLSREAVRRFWDGYVGKAVRRLGPIARDRGFNNVLIDSYEVACQNWTDGLEKIFRDRKGYDLLPFLPVFAGRIVGSVDGTENFLADFRRVVADLFAENYAGEFARLCHANGLQFSLEGYGSSPTDDLRYARQADIPMGEFWSAKGDVDGRLVGDVYNCRFPGFISHVWGRRYVAAEAFTSDQRERWDRAPFDYKAQGDRVYCQGVNRIVYHRWAHQPWLNAANFPGMTMGSHGAHFERTQTWWQDAAAPWLAYQSRCQWMLQEGRHVADVLVFSGDQSPNYGMPLPRWHAYGGVDDDGQGSGRKWDVFADDALQRLAVVQGDVVAPSGSRYKAVVIPPTAVVSKTSRERLEDLRREGALVVEGVSADSVLSEMGVMPDFICLTRGCADDVRWIHREMDDGSHVYFIACANTTNVTFQISLRAKGRSCEIWDAESGRMHGALCQMEENRTLVTLDFKPSGSAFVVLRPQRTAGLENMGVRHVVDRVDVDGSWRVRFLDGRGAPSQDVDFDGLAAWNENPDPRIRYYSGSAEYRKEVMKPVISGNMRLVLDLGDVKNVAVVTVNGDVYPCLWRPPFKLDITDSVRKADDCLQLVVRVTNLWPNRLIGDEFLPCDAEYGPDGGIEQIPNRLWHEASSPCGRHAFTTWQLWKKGDRLLPSGLIGPVRFEIEIEKKVP